ncbi:MAG TPA: hypothetical protein VG826_06235 [Pirellulales bacterium]|nr:hypothetical protein [Pirellulales bacterium]
MLRPQFTLRALLVATMAAACCVAPLPAAIDLFRSASWEAVGLCSLLALPFAVIAVALIAVSGK